MASHPIGVKSDDLQEPADILHHLRALSQSSCSKGLTTVACRKAAKLVKLLPKYGKICCERLKSAHRVDPSPPHLTLHDACYILFLPVLMVPVLHMRLFLSRAPKISATTRMMQAMLYDCSAALRQ